MTRNKVQSRFFWHLLLLSASWIFFSPLSARCCIHGIHKRPHPISCPQIRQACSKYVIALDFPSLPPFDWDSAASAIWQVPVSCQGTKINLYLVSTALNDGAGSRCTAARQPFLPYALSTSLHANTAICSLADLLFFLARHTKGGNPGSDLFLL